MNVGESPVTVAPAPDRRRRRHEQTLEEIVDVAAAIMGEEGVAGLSLGEVARRMQIRTPSLYTYFPSKNALYDALFSRGWELLNQAMTTSWEPGGDDPHGSLLAGVRAFTRWAVEHPAYAQLMFWRPVPGFRPSPEAYAAALTVRDGLHAAIIGLRADGVLRADVDLDEAATALTVLVSGVIGQQLANAPQDGFDDGAFTGRLPELVLMYLARYGTRPDSRSTTQGDDHGHPTQPGRRRGPAADDADTGTGGGAAAVRRVRRPAARPHR
ncbi:MAG: TetR/AcrR family transcriptional regulator [Jatrophihabitans sp.]|nr:MAG: TetR/AcrR family transcriptional regulator [Jatrophihabitans sp.]